MEPQLDQATAARRTVDEHLLRHPDDARYVQLLLEHKEFSPDDRNYLAWLRHNLRGIDTGRELISRLEAVIGGFKGARALDIGAGGGGHAIALAEYGCETTALEIDETRLQWLRARVKDHRMQVRIATQKIESLPKEADFDVVICNAVLEHVDEWRLFLTEVLNRCPKGVIYMSWPNKLSILEVLKDQHYGLFGAVFLTGSLRRLQAPYIKLRGVRRNAWVTAIPSLGAVRRQSVRTHPKTEIDTLAPVGIEKITNPEAIKHRLARTVLCTLKRTRIIPQQLMKQLVIDQGVTREVLIFPNGKAQRVVALDDLQKQNDLAGFTRPSGTSL